MSLGPKPKHIVGSIMLIFGSDSNVQLMSCTVYTLTSDPTALMPVTEQNRAGAAGKKYSAGILIEEGN